MDPRSTWILRPAGVCVVGALMVVCGLAAAGGALAAPGQSMLRPDAPPSGAVVSPTPDQPIRSGAEGDAVARLRPPLPPSGGRACRASHPVARPHAKPRRGSRHETRCAVFPAPTARSEVGQDRAPAARALPDSVRAFLATPITRVSDRRARPRDHGPRGHISRDGGPRCRLPDRGRRAGWRGSVEVRAFAVTVASAVIVLAWPASAMALDGPSPTCNQGSCVGWFNGAGVPVAVSWSAPAGASLTDCHFETITADTSGTNVSCGAYYAAQQQTVTVTVTVRRDTTPPQVTSVSPARAPDANGWYNHAVALTFAGSDATSGIASCDAPTYSGPDSGSATVAGVCRDAAGNTSAPAALCTQVRRHGAGGRRVARARPGCKRLVLEADHRLLRGQRRDLGDRVMHGPRHLHRAGRRRRERRRQLHGRRRQPHLCGGVDSLRLDAAERRRRAGPAARRERLVFQAALDQLQGQRQGLGRRFVHAPDPLRKTRQRRRQDHGNVSRRGRQRELAGDDVLQVRCDSTDGTGGEDRRRRWQRHTRMAERGRRGELRGPARAWPRSADRASLLWHGTGRRFVDHSVKNGTRYRYVVRARDQAGNTAEKSVDVTPLLPVFAPAPGTVTHRSPRSFAGLPIRRRASTTSRSTVAARRCSAAGPRRARSGFLEPGPSEAVD